MAAISQGPRGAWRRPQPIERVIHRLRAVAGEQVLLAMMVGIPALLRHPVWRPVRADQGKGQGVLLIPGFGFGDRSLALLSMWLRARGYRPAGARIGLNVGCTSTLVTRLERRVAEHAQATGRRVIVLGQSRGGWLGRLVAIRRPDLVRALVMLASPVLDPLGVNPKSVRVARMLTRLSALGLPGLVDEDCFSGECYRISSDGLAAPVPASVPALAVYSRQDRIVPWRLCLDPCAECVEVSSSHTGMGLDPRLYAILEPKLTAWAAIDEDGRVRAEFQP